MGRPIKKTWFRDGIGKQIKINAGTWRDGTPIADPAEVYIESQTGTREYRIVEPATGKADNLKLTNLNTPLAGQINIQADQFTTTPAGALNGLWVSKIQQYRVTAWDTPNVAVSDTTQLAWSDVSGADNPFVTATAIASIDASFTVDSLTPVLGGAGYVTEPVVTISAPDAVPAILGAVGNTGGVVDSIAITDGGSGYVGGETVTIIGTGSYDNSLTDITVATVDAIGAITGFTFTNGGTGADGTESASVSGPITTQAVYTAVLTGDAVTSYVVSDAGAGYVTIPSVTVAAP